MRSDFLESIFDAGWEDFVRQTRQANSRSNRRLFKLLKAIKNESFVHSLNLLSKMKGGLPQIRVTRKPKGMLLPDNRYSEIPYIWIDQRQQGIYGPGIAEGEIYVQVKENRWVYFYYTTA